VNPEHAERRFKHRSCTGKIRYRDRSEAIVALQKAKRRRGTPLRIYECDLCRGFHLSSTLVTHRRETP